MKRFSIFALALLGALALFGQGARWYQVPLWTGASYTWPRLGASFEVVNGTLEVKAAKARKYGVVLTYDSTRAAWILPAGAVDVVIHVNGLRYTAGTDYAITGSEIKALSEGMAPESLVVADFGAN